MEIITYPEYIPKNIVKLFKLNKDPKIVDLCEGPTKRERVLDCSLSLIKV